MGYTTWMMRLFYGAGGILGLAIGLLYFFQEKLLYVPNIPGVPADYYIPPEKYGLNSRDVAIMTKDGIRLHAWLLTLKGWTEDMIKSRPVILFFQENAGNMSFRLPFLRAMMYRLNCPIFAVSYRGYGLSHGRPNERGLQLDAEAALKQLRGLEDVNGSKVVVFGRSLGGAVAIHLTAAHQEEVVALIVENTFTSVEDMVSRVLPPLGLFMGQGKPLNFLVTNKWRNLEEIKKIKKVPMLMMVSLQDEMVPASQMFQLHRAQQAERCSLVEFPDAHHMDAYDVSPEPYWGALRDFMQPLMEQ
mmetsp:Transcript_2031/g.4500  ORF Transcript_2031/g.4500 Transcript_2031/m.4500 type:complete len:302 (-) Transcript_2031:403-1308(-)